MKRPASDSASTSSSRPGRERLVGGRRSPRRTTCRRDRSGPRRADVAAGRAGRAGHGRRDRPRPGRLACAPRLPPNVTRRRGRRPATCPSRRCSCRRPAAAPRPRRRQPALQHLVARSCSGCSTCTARHGRLRDATLMLQREVADRLVAAPGSKTYGVLSIAVQLDADVIDAADAPAGRLPARRRRSRRRWSGSTFRPPAVRGHRPRLFDDAWSRRSSPSGGRRWATRSRPLAPSTRAATPASVLRAAGHRSGAPARDAGSARNWQRLADALRPASATYLWYSSPDHHDRRILPDFRPPSGLTGPGQARRPCHPWSPERSRGVRCPQHASARSRLSTTTGLTECWAHA